MDNPFAGLMTFVEDKPWIAVGAVAGGVGVVAFVMRSRPSKDEEDTDAETADMQDGPLGQQFAGYMPQGSIPVIGNYVWQGAGAGGLRTPVQQTLGTTTVTRSTDTGNRVPVEISTPGSKAAWKCPPGYVLAGGNTAATQRCSMVDATKKVKGQRTSFFPSKGIGAYMDNRQGGMATPL